MAEDWALDVKKYAPAADDGVIAAIVRYCGIALRTGDAAMVSFGDPAETDRVRENYLKKKLGLTDADAVLDAGIAAVGARMSGDGSRNRVTVYYLLAEHFGRLGVFGPAVDGIDSAPVLAPLAAADSGRRGAAATGYGDYLPMALLVLGGAGLLWYLSAKDPAPVAEAAPAATGTSVAVRGIIVPPGVSAIVPAGAAVIASTINGEPRISVYFATAKSDIEPDFETQTADLRAYLTTHPDEHLQVSGYNDPRGDAAMNAELSKNRAFAVRDALVRLGVAAKAIDLVKPAETSDDDTGSLEQARRVDITVEDGPVVSEDVQAPAPAAETAN